jgi:molybdate/tungstate transport system ATP-binding protein
VGTFVLDSISFEVATGQYAVLMGRTGAGKTTLLETICGLRRLERGRIWLLDREVTPLKPAERGIGFVPQDGALFETMTVRDQLGFALTIRRRTRREIGRRIAELADLLGIKKLLDRKPAGLSGGERQRVALGRALAAEPGILCLDEPLSALDDATREEMYGLLSSVRQITGVTTLHITHNRSEAGRLADVVLLLEAGTIRPIAPRELVPDFPSPLPADGPRRHAAGRRPD